MIPSNFNNRGFITQGQKKTYDTNNGAQSISRTQTEFNCGWVTVKGDKEQQERAQNLISELRNKIGIQAFNMFSSVYTKLATILSKDKNATTDDIVNTFKSLSNPNDSTLISAKGIEDLLDNFIRKVGSSGTNAQAYINSDVISVSLLQSMLQKVAHGEDFIIPTHTMPTETVQNEPKEDIVISREDVLRQMENNVFTKKFGSTVTKGYNTTGTEPKNYIIGKQGIIREW